MQSRFHRAGLRASDGADFFDGKVLEEMQQQNRTLRWRQLIEQCHKLGFLFLADEQVCRTVLEFGRGRSHFLKRVCFATASAPALNTFLMGDAKEPASEPVVVAQAVDVSRGTDE